MKNIENKKNKRKCENLVSELKELHIYVIYAHICKYVSRMHVRHYQFDEFKLQVEKLTENLSQKC